MKHGHATRGSMSRTYKIWAQMRQRCQNSNDRKWPDYGGRGIQVCPRWESFENFLADMGECPRGLSIERKRNDGNYEPGNCRWATRKEQGANKRNNRWVTVDGVRRTLSQWADALGTSYHVVKNRIDRYGWDPARAVSQPVYPITRRRDPSS